MAVTTDSLAYEWIGKKADDDGTEHANADADKATWYGNVGSLNITLANFDWAATDGWAGSGTAADPYALHNDGTQHTWRSSTGTNATWQSSAFSIEQWICPEAYISTFSGDWFTNTNATNNGIRVYTASTDNGIGIRTGNGSGYSYFDLQAAFTPSTWAHYIITYTGTNLYSYWNNNKTSQGAVTIQSNTTANVSPFFAGADGDRTHGSIATVRFYTKALSDAEVANNFNAGILAASNDGGAAFSGIVLYHTL